MDTLSSYLLSFLFTYKFEILFLSCFILFIEFINKGKTKNTKVPKFLIISTILCNIILWLLYFIYN